MADGKFQDVEQGHLRLEESIDRLRQSLQHWQTWDAEYEGLKEEILAHKSNFSEDGLSTIGRDFGGTLLRDKEIKEVLQDGRGNIRSPKQVADVLSRRIDYVQDNIRIIEKQLDSAEGMLSSLQGQKSSSEEDTLPLTEILEELDEVGNVISSSTSTPGSVAPQLLEVLQKAGLDDPDHVKEGEYGETVAETARSEDLHRSTKRASAMATPTSPTSPDFGSEPSDALPSRRKKSVTFTQDTKVEAPASSKLKFAPRKARQDETVEPAIIPTDESEGDAALRKDMLKYGLSEVGAVVAELELDDSGTLGSYSDDDTDYLDGDESVSTTDEDEDEDDHGRSKKRVLDDEYLGRMEALSKKLDARMIENVGPDPADSQTSKDEPDSTDKGVNDDSSGKKSTKKARPKD
ncbi:MAG: hypothetical protein M1832_004186 [Thelocarpon impressellum]|nr:MAG: hypothetical protein M1832_004186 [Thelocarpon impressellum]